MNYTNGSIVQTYNVLAGRVVQLPCFYDMQEPVDGFRAVVFATPVIGTIQQGETTQGNFVNQNGPSFFAGITGSVDIALEFDLTPLMQNNSLSFARSIMASFTHAVTWSSQNINTPSASLLLDSGAQLFLNDSDQNTYYDSTATNAVIAFEKRNTTIAMDFVSAIPKFAVTVQNEAIQAGTQCVIQVANFPLRPHG